MKRIVWTLLVALLVFSFAVPASAQDMDTCSHGGATIGDLRACLEHAVMMGFVDNQGVALSLFAKIDAAQAALDNGQSMAAVDILGSLIDQLEAQSGIHIDAEHAAHMITHTQQVIAALS
jgi:hypothetical protein